MQGILLDREAQLHRKVLQADGSYADTLISRVVRCAIVPVSSFAQTTDYVYQATHVVWVDYWLLLRLEDELRWGTRPPDAEGETQPYIYTIRGQREFRMGPTQSAYYAEELR